MALRVGIVGAAGTVGSALAHRLAGSGLASELHLLDPRRNLLDAHLIDIREAAVLESGRCPGITIADPGRPPPVDLVIVAAAAPERPRASRAELLDGNAELLRGLLPAVETMAGEHGVVLVITNPVELMADLLRRRGTIPPERIVGYALNDTIRFRMALARELDVAPGRVDALVLGEHGARQVPLFDRVRVDGRAATVDAAARGRVRQAIDGWFPRWAGLRAGRSTGWTTSCGIARVLSELGTGRHVPASVWTGGRFGLAPTFLTLPATLSVHGVAGVHLPPEATDAEAADLRRVSEELRAEAGRLAGSAR